MRQVCLDTETTGLDYKSGHRIIELGCVELLDGKLTGNDLHIYFNPERDSDPDALRVHGLTTEFLSDKPLFADEADRIIEYLSGAQLIIHNAAFDMGFLNSEFSLSKKPLLDSFINGFIDSRNYARENGFASAVITLDKLYKDLVDESFDKSKDRKIHGALLDATMLAKVFIKLNSGQNDLFSEVQVEAKQEHGEAVTSGSVDLSKFDLKLVKLSEEEMKAHSEYIATLAAESKKEINW